jgi:hypothetical protein
LVWALVLAAQILWPAARVGGERTRTALLVLVACSAAVLLFLLPPFQGPDEWAHWKAALLRFRHDAPSEAALFNLPEALDSFPVRARSENPFESQRLLSPPSGAGVPEPRRGYVDYANALTYPFVGLVGLLFPRVETTAEALLFYYLCRALPAAALLGLLFRANRAGLLSWTGLTFFSSPLVLQQFVVLTSDTVANLGTVLAVLLFAARRGKPDWRRTLALWLVCLAAAAAKPPLYAGLLLLPLWFVPYHKVPAAKLTVPLAGAALVVLGVLGFLWRLRGSLRALGQPGGASQFLEACRYLVEVKVGRLSSWFEPLGWLDTYFGEEHLWLIRVGVLLALVLDLVLVVPGLVRGCFRSWGRVSALAGTVAAHALIAFLVPAWIYYYNFGSPTLFGVDNVQVRYLFSAVMLALMLPMAFAERKPGEEEGRLRVAAGSAALALMPLVLFARQVELAVDLLVRYW